MDLAVAIGAEEHALPEFRFDFVPGSCDPAVGETERLGLRISMVELKAPSYARVGASRASSAHLGDSPGLQLPSLENSPVGGTGPLGLMASTMTVRTNERAFLDLRQHARPTSGESAKLEVLFASSAVMELKGSCAGGVTALLATSTLESNKSRLERLPTALLVGDPLTKPPPASFLTASRVARRVVCPEWGAVETELASVEIAPLAIDGHPCPKARTAFRTDAHDA